MLFIRGQLPSSSFPTGAFPKYALAGIYASPIPALPALAEELLHGGGSCGKPQLFIVDTKDANVNKDLEAILLSFLLLEGAD